MRSGLARLLTVAFRCGQRYARGTLQPLKRVICLPRDLSVDAFIRKWQANELKERSAAQEHFIDLCHVLGEPTPADADPTGESYCFERGATKATGGEGWADVWKRGCFGWEYGSDLEDRPRYTHTSTFATFPFPVGMTPDIDPAQARALPAATAIEAAAARLDGLRNGWLYPADLIVRVPDVRPGFPDRVLPRDDAAAQSLARRTLTALYNEAPDWLAEAHRALDDAVAAAYGWPAGISVEDALSNLLKLNVGRPH